MLEIAFSANRSNVSHEQPDRHQIRPHLRDLPQNLPDFILQLVHPSGDEFFFVESDRLPHRRVRQQPTVGQLQQSKQQRNQHLRGQRLQLRCQT
jgi:hypothetical protein